jgi:hypothetical protein
MALVIPPGQLIETAFERLQRPSMWRDMNLRAVGDGRDLDFEPERYRDGLLEGWLLFRDARGAFPVPPGGTVTLEYSYRLPSDLCSPRFEQMVTMPTGPMTLCLEFPLPRAPSRVWGTEVSTSGEWIWPSPPARVQTATGVEFRCSVAVPVTGRTYRWEWPAAPGEGREAVSPAA